MAPAGAAAKKEENKEQVPAAAGVNKVPSRANELALYKRDVVDAVASKVQQYISKGELHLPQDYSPDNALKAAWLILQDVKDMNDKPALDVCTRNSVANSLLKMIIQGLDPNKNQGYFIVYGTALSFQRSYFGTMALARRVNPEIPEDGFAYSVVYKGDELEYEISKGKKHITVHKQKLENILKENIIAAYCEIYDKSGKLVNSELMTLAQMHQSWKQSKAKPFDDNGKLKPGSMHAKFTEDACIRTVINKAGKPIINASTDKALLENLNDLEDAAEARAEIEDNANKGDVLEIEAEEVGNSVDEERKDGEVDREKTAEENRVAAEKMKTVPGTVKCPDTGNIVARAACPACEKRPGCPEYEEPRLPLDKGEKKAAGRKPSF